MSPSPNMLALYNRPVVLWVEDVVTSDYFQECWQADPDIMILLAGGSNNIRAVVEASRQDGHTHVFGFVDRDLATGNVAQWLNATGNPVFVPAVHEVENYLLQADCLASCTLNTAGRSAADIEKRLLTRAGQLVWYMACRKVLVEMRAEILANFPGFPQVMNQHDAEQHILTCSWHANLAARAATLTVPAEVTKRLLAAHGVMAGALGSGAWRRDYPGKDLFHDLRDWLHPPVAGVVLSAQQRDRDLTRSVAQYQVANNLVPNEVLALRAALRQRVGLAP